MQASQLVHACSIAVSFVVFYFTGTPSIAWNPCCYFIPAPACVPVEDGVHAIHSVVGVPPVAGVHAVQNWHLIAASIHFLLASHLLLDKIFLSLASLLLIESLILLASLLCRASMHYFFIDCQSLRELRIMGVLIIAITQKKCG